MKRGGKGGRGRWGGWRERALAAALLMLSGALAAAQPGQQPGSFQMPDMKQMSGIPRPVTDLPNAAISVRVIRGDLANNIANQPVELHAGSKTTTVKTDDGGRAQFSGVAPGTTVKATTVVDGERLESQEFPVPAQGGIRLMLVATDHSKAPATSPDAPAINGTVIMGSQSRIVVEPGDEGLNVYYLLDIENTARVPVNTATPFVFELPKAAVNATLMEGSSPTASISGGRLAVKAPFAPGPTFVQVAFTVPGGDGSVDVTQAFPADFAQLQVIVKKVGATTLKSAQVMAQQEMPAEGETFIAGTGGKLVAGQPLTLTVSGYPHHSSAPRLIAMTLTVTIVLIGVWTARRPEDEGSARAAERQQLIARREKHFQELVRLERDHRGGRVDDRRYASRREELIGLLESVYGALDDGDAMVANGRRSA